MPRARPRPSPPRMAACSSLFPASAASLDAAREASLARLHPGRSRDEGSGGRRSSSCNARAALARRFRASGADRHRLAAGEWQTTPGCPPAGGILVHWRNLQPFAIENSAQLARRRPRSEPALRAQLQ